MPDPDIQFSIPTGQPMVIVSCSFPVSAHRVFAAMTDASLIPDWWGPSVLTNTVEVMDVRPGGKWRIIQREPNREEYAFHGYYHLVDPDRRLVYTFEYEGEPGHVILESITLETVDGGTLLTDQSVFQSQADRDGMVAADMESGARESMQRLYGILTREH
jgi:uncharacterized protein YndB with AHSA1/START domain